jgi:hypothetical protein
MTEDFYRKNLFVRDNAVHLDLWYPNVNDNPDRIEIGLMHVRSSDNISISYDFDRDGWVISQAVPTPWETNAYAHDPDWKEVAFVQAWARAVNLEENNGESIQTLSE